MWRRPDKDLTPEAPTNPSALKAIRKLLLRRLQKTIVRPTCNLGRTIVSGDDYNKRTQPLNTWFSPCVFILSRRLL